MTAERGRQRRAGVGALASVAGVGHRGPDGGSLHAQRQTALLRVLVALRERAGLTQTALAQRLHITQSEVSKFERGERALHGLRLQAWLGALGVQLTAFVDSLDQELDRLDASVD
jgi:DNA-binding XRE family transcriptional regulator